MQGVQAVLRNQREAKRPLLAQPGSGSDRKTGCAMMLLVTVGASVWLLSMTANTLEPPSPQFNDTMTRAGRGFAFVVESTYDHYMNTTVAQHFTVRESRHAFYFMCGWSAMFFIVAIDHVLMAYRVSGYSGLYLWPVLLLWEVLMPFTCIRRRLQLRFTNWIHRRSGVKTHCPTSWCPLRWAETTGCAQEKPEESPSDAATGNEEKEHKVATPAVPVAGDDVKDERKQTVGDSRQNIQGLENLADKGTLLTSVKLEAKMPDSYFLDMPKMSPDVVMFQVELGTEFRAIGMGFRARTYFPGQSEARTDVIFTNAHVLKSLLDYVANIRVVHNQQVVVFKIDEFVTSVKTLLWSPSFARDGKASGLDFVALQFPLPILSQLSVAVGEWDTKPMHGTPLEVEGAVIEEKDGAKVKGYKVSRGYLDTKRVQNAFFGAHSCSTVPSWSGTPVRNMRTRKILGLHTGSFASQDHKANCAVMLGFVFGRVRSRKSLRPESYDDPRDGPHEEFERDEESDYDEYDVNDDSDHGATWAAHGNDYTLSDDDDFSLNPRDIDVADRDKYEHARGHTGTGRDEFSIGGAGDKASKKHQKKHDGDFQHDSASRESLGVGEETVVLKKADMGSKLDIHGRPITDLRKFPVAETTLKAITEIVNREAEFPEFKVPATSGALKSCRDQIAAWERATHNQLAQILTAAAASDKKHGQVMAQVEAFMAKMQQGDELVLHAAAVSSYDHETLMIKMAEYRRRVADILRDQRANNARIKEHAASVKRQLEFAETKIAEQQKLLGARSVHRSEIVADFEEKMGLSIALIKEIETDTESKQIDNAKVAEKLAFLTAQSKTSPVGMSSGAAALLEVKRSEPVAEAKAEIKAGIAAAVQASATSNSVPAKQVVAFHADSFTEGMQMLAQTSGQDAELKMSPGVDGKISFVQEVVVESEKKKDFSPETPQPAKEATKMAETKSTSVTPPTTTPSPTSPQTATVSPAATTTAAPAAGSEQKTGSVGVPLKDRHLAYTQSAWAKFSNEKQRALKQTWDDLPQADRDALRAEADLRSKTYKHNAPKAKVEPVQATPLPESKELKFEEDAVGHFNDSESDVKQESAKKASNKGSKRGKKTKQSTTTTAPVSTTSATTGGKRGKNSVHTESFVQRGHIFWLPEEWKDMDKTARDKAVNLFNELKEKKDHKEINKLVSEMQERKMELFRKLHNHDEAMALSSHSLWLKEQQAERDARKNKKVKEETVTEWRERMAKMSPLERLKEPGSLEWTQATEFNNWVHKLVSWASEHGLDPSPNFPLDAASYVTAMADPVKRQLTGNAIAEMAQFRLAHIEEEKKRVQEKFRAFNEKKVQ
jgi:hypothetical protein